jgi:hypothetical protein
MRTDAGTGIGVAGVAVVDDENVVEAVELQDSARHEGPVRPGVVEITEAVRGEHQPALAEIDDFSRREAEVVEGGARPDQRGKVARCEADVHGVVDIVEIAACRKIGGREIDQPAGDLDLTLERNGLRGERQPGHRYRETEGTHFHYQKPPVRIRTYIQDGALSGRPWRAERRRSAKVSEKLTRCHFRTF